MSYYKHRSRYCNIWPILDNAMPVSLNMVMRLSKNPHIMQVKRVKNSFLYSLYFTCLSHEIIPLVHNSQSLVHVLLQYSCGTYTATYIIVVLRY